jgi:hypothetical protein
LPCRRGGAVLDRTQKFSCRVIVIRSANMHLTERDPDATSPTDRPALSREEAIDQLARRLYWD